MRKGKKERNDGGDFHGKRFSKDRVGFGGAMVVSEKGISERKSELEIHLTFFIILSKRGFHH